MTRRRRFLTPQVPSEERASDAALPPVKERQQPELNDWEDEGGSLAEPPPSPRNRLDLAGKTRLRLP